MNKCACGNVTSFGQIKCGSCCDRDERASEIDEHHVRLGAEALLARRGLSFYDDPMEGGQDAYDLSLEAMEEVRVVLRAVRSA